MKAARNGSSHSGILTRIRRSPLWRSTPAGLIVNILLVYVCYEVCRLAFLFENSDSYASMTWADFRRMSAGGFRFDTSAIFYTNALFILLYLLPLHLKERRWYHMMTKWVFVTVNSIAVLINLADSVFFTFRSQRSTMAVLDEFGGEGNLGGILGPEILSHWYLVILFAALVYMLWRLYRMPATGVRPLRRYYTVNSVTLVIAGFIAFCGMRGNVFFLGATRPISVGFAQRYAKDPIDTGLILNTPFSLIRTLGSLPQPTPQYFTQEELDALYTPVHVPADSVSPQRKNVVILIVESFAGEFVGGFNNNRALDNGTYRGYTPFADSLLQVATSWERSFDNTFFSIDAAPAVLASLPRMDKSFTVTPYSLNKLNSLATELGSKGYYSEFFHGADNESLGIHAFTQSIGYQHYSGINEFVSDPRFRGMDEFDGHWGIWDEPFLQYFCTRIGEMPEPFLATVFTLSSHHPFKVPDKYKDVFLDEGIHQLHKCIRYTDYSLRRFFDQASRQPWYRNTVFVLTADHGSSKRTHPEYKTDFGSSQIPIIFFDPAGGLPKGVQPGIAQQIDIMPTLLSYLGYDRPYVAFGKDLLTTPPDSTWALNWANTMPRYVHGDYVIQLSGDNVHSMYNYKEDPRLEHNLAGKGLPEEKDMERHAKAIIQSYFSRMNNNDVTIPSAK